MVNRKTKSKHNKTCFYIKLISCFSFLDIDYEIKTVTGDKTYEGGITFKIRGEFGVITIPLSQTISGEKPFQSKATDEFKCRTNDVGKIKRLIIEYNGTRTDNVWHLKTVQIIKADECYKYDGGKKSTNDNFYFIEIIFYF
jgi:hypothetical protein